MLQNTLNKTLMRLWRTELAEKFNKYASSRQGGARKGMGPQAHILRLRLHQRQAQLRGKSHAIVMVDIESAFYRTLRGLFVNTGEQTPDDQHINKVFRAFDLHPLQFDSTKDHLQETPALEEAKVNKAVQALIEDAFRGNWTRIKNSDTCIVPETGTRPGDPGADVLFSFVIKKVLDGIHTTLQAKGHSDHESNGLAWVDDLAFMVESDAKNIESKVQQTLTAIYNESMQRALKPSLQPGKTDILMRHVGPGTQHYKRKKEAEGTRISFESEDYGEQEAHCVNDAKYLGSIIDAKQRLLPDIIYSTSAAYNNVRPLRKQVLANKAIDPKKRVWVLQALGIAKAAYAGGTWPALSSYEAKTWDSRIYKLYELLEPPKRDGDERAHLYLLATYNLPTPEDILAAQRLRLLAMIARWADEQFLQGVIDSEGSADDDTWANQVLYDFQRFSGRSETFTNIIQAFRKPTGQKEMAKVIKRHNTKMRHVHQQRWKIWQHERKEGQRERKIEPGVLFPCEKCGKDFKSNTARAVHKWKVHHVHSAAAHFCPTSICLACGRDYHTLARVRQHVEYSSMDCLTKLMATYEPMDSQQIEYLNACARQEAKTTWKSGRLTTPQIKTYMKRAETAADIWYGEWTRYYDPENWEVTEKEELEWLQQEATPAIQDHLQVLRESSELWLAEIQRVGLQISSPKVAMVWIGSVEGMLRAHHDCTAQMLCRMADARECVLARWR